MGIAALICLAAAIALVICEWRRNRVGMAVSKCLASTAFVVAALLGGALDFDYGRLLLLAFALSWIGDICLLSSARLWFLSGIGAFLFAHVAFALAFGSRALDAMSLWVSGAVMLLFGLAMLRWLWRHLAVPFRFAVSAYVIAIGAMVTTAVAASVASGLWLTAVGAVAFALSDISVARDRFVATAIVNRVWGLPLYYAAQLWLVFSLRGVW